MSGETDRKFGSLPKVTLSVTVWGRYPKIHKGGRRLNWLSWTRISQTPQYMNTIKAKFISLKRKFKWVGDTFQCDFTNEKLKLWEAKQFTQIMFLTSELELKPKIPDCQFCTWTPYALERESILVCSWHVLSTYYTAGIVWRTFK